MPSVPSCTLCPRNCKADRTAAAGFCGCGTALRLAKAMLHRWEEPCLTGENGAGAVFFSGCNLRCCFCQNRPISHENFGCEISVERLGEIFLELEGRGAATLDLVTATPWLPQVVEALSATRARRHIPVVWNTGGYEKAESLRALSGLVDVWLPDLKFVSPALSARYCAAPDYFACAAPALREMFRQSGPVQMGENGVLQRGLLVRHLVMPGGWRDSIAVLEWLASEFGAGSILVSVMSQYTPVGESACRELARPISSYEYRKVAERAAELDFCGYTQERTSAKSEYTPDFDLSGVRREPTQGGGI